MIKRIICGLLSFSLILACGCGSGNPTIDVDGGFTSNISSASESEDNSVINPLTGVKDIKPGQENLRPVAVSIGNSSGIEPVQTGINKADIIYETETEGGITRLLAIYKDISKVGQIGCVRSARYDFADLAGGHDALFYHCGLDMDFCAPHLVEIGSDHIDINTGLGAKYGFREANGKASWHTMYTSGEKITAGTAALERRSTTEVTSWLKFAEYQKDAATVAATSALSVTVNFPANISTFDYDSQTGKYVRMKNGKALTDWKTGEKILFKNIFVLDTTMTYFEGNYRRDIDLDGGNGYYISNGTYTEITWSKGDAYDALVIKNKDGSEFTANAGNSWICIKNTSSGVKFTAAPEQIPAQ